jgi:hypothetical protein
VTKQVVRATYDAENKLLRLHEPLEGVPDGAILWVTITRIEDDPDAELGRSDTVTSED